MSYSFVYFLFLSPLFVLSSAVVVTINRVKLKNFLESPVMGNLSAGLASTASRLVTVAPGHPSASVIRLFTAVIYNYPSNLDCLSFPA